MKPPLDVIFVILDVKITVDNAAVLQTQVGDQILALRRLGLRPGLACTVEDAERFARVLGDRLTEAGVPVWTVRHRGLWANLIALLRVVYAIYRRSNARKAYARSIWSALAIRLAAPGGKLPYVYDVRGALGDETVTKGSPVWKAWVFTRLERAAVRGARHVSTVSARLAAHLRFRYGVDDVVVIPSCVNADLMVTDDHARDTSRAALGFPPDAIVFAYSGGLNYYQQVPEMLALWRCLLADPRVHFMLLTNDTPHVHERAFDLKAFGRRLVHRSVPHSEVHGLLLGADVGFLLREQLPLNAVASPVKAAEYLMAGLALVVSPQIGDLSSLVERQEIGVLVPAGDPLRGSELVNTLLARLDHDRIGFRRRARETAMLYYDWKAYAPIFQRFYG